MIAYRKNCKICGEIKKNSKLMTRIYASSFYIPHSKDTLRHIYLDCMTSGLVFSYPSLLNHAKKHQHLNAGDYQEKMLRHKSKMAENRIMADRFQAIEVQDAVMNKGMEKLENGDMKITADHLLRAAKDKQDFQTKTRDQQLQLAEMVAFYASSEDKYESDKIYDTRVIALEEYDPSIPITGDPDTRQD
jgi:hypothetical protein